MIAPLVIFDIDFDAPALAYEADTDEERSALSVFSWKTHPHTHESRVNNFELIGRAFFAIDDNEQRIEELSFFIEARKAAQARRFIDAFNCYYLFLKSNLKLNSRKKAATKELSSSSVFCNAVDALVAEPRTLRDYSIIFTGLTQWPHNKSALCDEIVGLRGFLRHHSIGNPNRWSPHFQEKYLEHTIFLGLVCIEIANPMSFDRTWHSDHKRNFLQCCEEINAMIDIAVVLTIKEEDNVREVGLKLRFPGLGPSPLLSKAALQKTLEIFDERSPAAEVLGIRARIKPNGPELFRYDLGPGVGR